MYSWYPGFLSVCRKLGRNVMYMTAATALICLPRWQRVVHGIRKIKKHLKRKCAVSASAGHSRSTNVTCSCSERKYCFFSGRGDEDCWRRGERKKDKQSSRVCSITSRADDILCVRKTIYAAEWKLGSEFISKLNIRTQLLHKVSLLYIYIFSFIENVYSKVIKHITKAVYMKFIGN